MKNLTLNVPQYLKVGNLNKDLQNKKKSSEYVIAKLLIISPLFNEMINDAKNHPDKAPMAKTICNIYKLTPNWIPSIIEAIKNGTLDVPIPYHNIQIYHPLIGNPYYNFDAKEFPGIFFTHKIRNTGEITKWIKNNIEAIKVITKDLPEISKINSTKVSPKNLLVGQLVTIAEAEGKEKFIDILDYLRNHIENITSENDILRDIFEDEVDEDTLRHSKKAFLSLNKIISES